MTTQPEENLPRRWMKSTGDRGMWVDPDDDPRDPGAEPDTEPTDERGILLDYLRRYRLTLEMKCADLDAEQLARRSAPPSTMSLLGLIRHMADVERHWFRREMSGLDAPPLFWSKENPDGDFDDAAPEQEVVDDAWRAWREEVAFAEEYVEQTPDLSTPSMSGNLLRDILVHMIEEYARHCGHADLLRERIDGRIGQ